MRSRDRRTSMSIDHLEKKEVGPLNVRGLMARTVPWRWGTVQLTFHRHPESWRILSTGPPTGGPGLTS